MDLAFCLQLTKTSVVPEASVLPFSVAQLESPLFTSTVGNLEFSNPLVHFAKIVFGLCKQLTRHQKSCLA